MAPLTNRGRFETLAPVAAGLTRRVSTPDGSDWTVRRVWFAGRRLKSWSSRRDAGTGLIDGLPGDSVLSGLLDGSDLADGLVLLADGLVLLAAGLALILVVIPLLLFGLELVILGFVLAAGVVGRSLFGKPWTVTASPSGDPTPAGAWRVKGWHRSAQLIDQVCADIEVRGELEPVFPGAEFVSSER
jgi:hypothetical protein